MNQMGKKKNNKDKLGRKEWKSHILTKKILRLSIPKMNLNRKGVGITPLAFRMISKRSKRVEVL